jgi:rRNA maturation endonuclease Nob1
MASGDSRKEVNEMIFLVDKNKVKHYTSDSDYTIPTDSINAIPFGFALSSDWEGYTLTSQITKADKTINILLDKNNAGMIPPDMEEGIWNVSLFGVKDGSKRNTTIPATLKLVKSGYNPQGQPPIQPPEDLYAKLIKQIDEANKIAQSVRDDADAGKFDGKDGADGKDGKSAYELAVENGFVGKEQEWLESLRYDHSEEFTKLAEQVKQDSVSASNSAQAASRSATNAASSEANAKRSENASKQSEVNAKQSETNAEKSAKATKLSEANAKVSEMEAKKSEESAKQSADYAAQSVDSIVDKLAIKSESKEETHLIQDSVDYAFDEFFMYGKSTQSGTPSPETPAEIVSAGQSGQIKIDVLGGNLLDLSKGKSGTGEGVTYTKNPDGSYRRTGTATGVSGNVWFLGGYSVDPNLQEKVLFTLKQGTYTVKDCVLVSNKKALRNTFTIDSDFKVTGVRNPTQVVGQTYNDVLYPMLNVGSSALPFESYKQPQTIILTTPNGLSGIPVSGDDYTYIDSTGQKWIADTIEYRKDGKCVRVQRIGKHKISQVASINNGRQQNPDYFGCEYESLIDELKNRQIGILCNKNIFRGENANLNGSEMTYISNNGFIVFGFPKKLVQEQTVEAVNNYLKENPFDIIYPLKQPVETLLTPEEIAAFKALHTNKPTTTIINNAGITTKVKYITDTKKYIDSKFVALAKQLIKS